MYIALHDHPQAHPLVRAADRARLPEESFSHPLNPRSEIHGFSTGATMGIVLTDTEVNALRER